MSTSRKSPEPDTVFGKAASFANKRAVSMDWKHVGALLAGLAAIATITATIIMPFFVSQARDASREDMRLLLDKHEAIPLHGGAVSRNEFRLLQEQLRDLKDTVNNRFDRIEAKIQ